MVSSVKGLKKSMAEHKSSMKKEPNIKLLLVLLFLGSIISIILAIGIGPVSVHPGTVAKILMSKLPVVTELIDPNWTRLDENIVCGNHIPQVAVANFIILREDHDGRSPLIDAPDQRKGLYLKEVRIQQYQVYAIALQCIQYSRRGRCDRRCPSLQMESLLEESSELKPIGSY